MVERLMRMEVRETCSPEVPSILILSDPPALQGSVQQAKDEFEAYVDSRNIPPSSKTNIKLAGLQFLDSVATLHTDPMINDLGVAKDVIAAEPIPGQDRAMIGAQLVSLACYLFCPANPPGLPGTWVILGWFPSRIFNGQVDCLYLRVK